jgi:hypothetical protein
MSTNVPKWVGEALVAAREQKIADGKLIPGRERAHLTQREAAFLQVQIDKQAAPVTAEAVVFDALNKLNKMSGRR